VLNVSNLDKIFFPKEKYTKGDVMRYYTRTADFILPTIQDRPLVLKRFPNGIDGESFYQHKPSETTPPEVRVEVIETEGEEKQPRIIGGDLLNAALHDPARRDLGRSLAFARSVVGACRLYDH